MYVGSGHAFVNSHVHFLYKTPRFSLLQKVFFKPKNINSRLNLLVNGIIFTALQLSVKQAYTGVSKTNTTFWTAKSVTRSHIFEC